MGEREGGGEEGKKSIIGENFLRKLRYSCDLYKRYDYYCNIDWRTSKKFESYIILEKILV